MNSTLGYSNTTVIGPGATGAGYINSVVLGSSSVNYIFGGSDIAARYYGVGFSIWSDKRIKTNITPLGSTLSNLSKLDGKRYFNTKSKTNDIGLIAQEIIKYYPELVQEVPYVDQVTGETTEKRYMVSYNGFVPILVNAVNEQQQMIKELQEKVDEIDELKEELESLKQLIMNNN